MKLSLFIFLITISTFLFGQSEPTNEQRKKFYFGTAIGVSAIQLNDPFQKNHQFGLSFPNFKIGYALSKRLVAGIYLPGSIYRFEGDTRTRERGFEGILPFVQYWPTSSWWINGAAGLCFDAPAFYDVKNETEADFYLGPELSFGTGYELWKKGKFVLDIQCRYVLGYSKLPNGKRYGQTGSLLLGFNWY